MSDPIRTLQRELQSNLRELQILTATQRGLRLGLRAAWLGIGGFLVGWALNRLGGWLPDRVSWLVLSFLFALFPLIELLQYLLKRKGWVYRLDGRMSLRGQVSTAWEQSQQEAPGLVAGALISDVINDLPDLQQRVERRGWALERELISAAVVLLLAFLVGLAALIQTFPAGQAEAAWEEIPLAAVPTLQPEPDAAQVFPQGPLGLGQPQGGEQGQVPGENGSGGNDGSQEGASELGQPDSQPGDATGPGESGAGALEEALQELGEALSGQAGTHELGEALQEMDLGNAAEEMDDLSGQLGELSDETRQNLSEAIGEAAQDLQDSGSPGSQGLAQDMEDAAESLEEMNRNQGESSEEQAQSGLGQAAEELRNLAEQMGGRQAAGGGAGDEGGSGQTGSAEPHDRLQGVGGDFDLEVDDPSNSGLLSPALPDAAGEGTASGSLDGAGPNSGTAGDSGLLVPNYFLWKWRDVVGQYFKR